jgi:hypothetical protein
MGPEVLTSGTITDSFSIMGLSPYGHSAAAALEASAFFLLLFLCLLMLEFWLLLAPVAFIVHLFYFGVDTFVIGFRILDVPFSSCSSNF